jgi:CRISPR-associated exonuclease Cas4
MAFLTAPVQWLLALALILLAVGWLLLRRSGALRRATGLPTGRLIYSDTYPTDWHTPPKPLYSQTHNLTGKPDYLVRTKQGFIPVEVKSANAPPVPYLGHILQLAAYCLLVEETMGRMPPHGLLKYADALYEVDFTPELRGELLDTLAEIRRDRQARNVKRSHDQPNKCVMCGFRQVCDEAIG